MLEMSIKLDLPAEQLGASLPLYLRSLKHVLLTRAGVLPQLCGAALRLDYPYYVQHLKHFPFSPHVFFFFFSMPAILFYTHSHWAAVPLFV